jgi:hypothetical protein
MTTRRAVGMVAATDAVLVGLLGGKGRRTAPEHPGDWMSQR